ncbi:plasma protease C1 inhibitor [Salminus brasiliensis]|uniref:plasma protease C1 inhibitor n=1 Tax=Salminus brasiliensis TaxID=930266 RepID=UPI003B8322A7
MLRGIILLLLLGVSSAVDDISLPVGSTFSVTCSEESDVNLFFPTYKWTFLPEKNQADIHPNSEIQLNLTEPVLTFNPVETKNAGLYTCVTKGQSSDGLMKLKRRFHLKVTDTVLHRWYLAIVQEGETAQLPCPIPQAQTDTNTSYSNGKWSKGDSTGYTGLTPVPSASDEEDKTAGNRISWAAGPHDRDWSIIITDVKLEDADWYRCEVTVGSEKHTVRVEMVVEPRPPPRCLNHTQPWEECPDPDSRSWKAVVSESITAFSAHLYSKLRSTQKGRNLLISPISIASLLSHLLLGARGQTRTELENALYLPIDFSCLHSEMKKMREEMKESLHVASQMFYNPRHQLGEAFVNQSLEFYDTVPEKLTDSSENNTEKINTWVKKKTQNKISKLVDSVEPSTEFILLNAVYFIGKWKGSFEEIVKNGEFITFSGEQVSVPSLYSSKFSLAMKYMTTLKAQVGKFALTGGSSLYVLVPTALTEKALAQVEDNLNENSLRAMVQELNMITPVSAEVTLPKTKLSINTDLASLLKKIGLSGLFDSPNLCAVFSEEEYVELTDGRHRAYLSLTEQGVEAAAASGVSFSRSFNTFSAMQPFVFVVWSEQTDSPLFMGRVIDPTEAEGK